jgi:hypothetical protein
MSPFRLSTLAGLIAGCSALAAAHAAAAAPHGLEGRWTLAPGRSRFAEAVTGPAPSAATWTVSRDEGGRFAYTLVEQAQGSEDARGAYDVSLSGGRSESKVDDVVKSVSASREASGLTIIRGPVRAGYQASIRIQATGPDEATINHVVTGPDGDHVLEYLVMTREHSQLLAQADHTAR